jgi:hypothetical protein
MLSVLTCENTHISYDRDDDESIYNPFTIYAEYTLPLVLLLPKLCKFFGVPTFRLRAYLMKGGYRNAFCALNFISTFLFLLK